MEEYGYVQLGQLPTIRKNGMLIQYAIFNDLTEAEKEKFSASDRWLTEQVGANFQGFQFKEAWERVAEINEYRQNYRLQEPDNPLAIDRIVGRPVNVTLKMRNVTYSAWKTVSPIPH